VTATEPDRSAYCCMAAPADHGFVDARHVGIGFTQASLGRRQKLLEPLQVDQSPVDPLVPASTRGSGQSRVTTSTPPSCSALARSSGGGVSLTKQSARPMSPTWANEVLA